MVIRINTHYNSGMTYLHSTIASCSVQTNCKICESKYEEELSIVPRFAGKPNFLFLHLHISNYFSILSLKVIRWDYCKLLLHLLLFYSQFQWSNSIIHGKRHITVIISLLFCNFVIYCCNIWRVMKSLMKWLIIKSIAQFNFKDIAYCVYRSSRTNFITWCIPINSTVVIKYWLKSLIFIISILVRIAQPVSLDFKKHSHPCVFHYLDYLLINS